MPFAATWMQLEILILNEGSQKEKDKYHMISLILYMESKTTQMNLSIEQKQTYRHGKQTYSCQGGENGMDGEFGVSRCKLLHLERIRNEICIAQGTVSSHL